MTDDAWHGARPRDARPPTARCSTRGIPQLGLGDDSPRSPPASTDRARRGDRPTTFAAVDVCRRSDRRSTSTRRRRRRPTCTCACTCCRTGLCKPRTINLDGMFGLLDQRRVDRTSARSPSTGRRGPRCADCAGRPASSTVHGLDKFPRMTDYVVPTGVRIADADRVRLGAHLADGHHRDARGVRATSTPARSGTSMVEGRISARA